MIGKWIIGLIYIVAVAAIWIAASYVVQSVVDEGVSPFLITYICNSLFIIYIPLVEAARYLEDYTGNLCFWRKKLDVGLQELAHSEPEEVVLLKKSDLDEETNSMQPHLCGDREEMCRSSVGTVYEVEKDFLDRVDVDEGLDSKGRWTRTRVARVSLLICPFWFLAQLAFNLSLKYTTVSVRRSIALIFLWFSKFLAISYRI